MSCTVPSLILLLIREVESLSVDAYAFLNIFSPLPWCFGIIICWITFCPDKNMLESQETLSGWIVMSVFHGILWAFRLLDDVELNQVVLVAICSIMSRDINVFVWVVVLICRSWPGFWSFLFYICLTYWFSACYYSIRLRGPENKLTK